MLSTIKSIAVITGLSLGLAGCLMVHTVKQELLYSPEYVNYASTDGILPLEISGNPLGKSQLAGQKLMDALQIPNWISAQNLRQLPPDERGQGHRLVMVFNPSNILTDGDTLCADPAPKTNKPGSHMKIIAALCHGSRNVTRATAEGDVTASLQDPLFIQLLNYLMTEIMPIKNSDHDTTDCQASPCG
ncbi:MAG: hypothetical protein HOE62_03375 [Alphaproteobacteria bacterium]|jgi:hypothetical protein|nr:hypothetical protein [Alphaproteobacteria bacterium]MBT4016967.1 hypothetical protein [Alphaproteobacteria bacterium]MBT4965257.1 hypothetical protein [Alphaproteobacteria bacterium]MBT5162207.1 hypothetical protein [Alphaproteobacteria bacterium]MBT5918947.1 hypothetical protein [Alphaproteobacteria bacterium]